ncbi:MAG: hypothetical protein V3V92_00080 [Candidatus Hydrothermarchaeales archaeon]
MKSWVQGLMVVVIVLLLGVAVYEFVLISRGNELRERERLGFAGRLKALEDELILVSGGAVRVDVGLPPSLCFECHDEGQTKVFHDVDRVLGLQDQQEYRRRICTNCHGPPLNSSSPVPDRDLPYPGDDSHPHRIHQRKSDLKVMFCETCHVYEGEFRYPKPLAGQLLVCELCHGSNLIVVHVEGKIIADGAELDERWVSNRSGLSCLVCHMGDIMGVHKGATEMLGTSEIEIKF